MSSTYERIAEEIRHEIMSGRLKRGDSLPTISQLRTRFGVTQTTITRALRLLESEVLIERPTGRPWRVAIETGRRTRTPGHPAAWEYVSSQEALLMPNGEDFGERAGVLERHFELREIDGSTSTLVSHIPLWVLDPHEWERHRSRLDLLALIGQPVAAGVEHVSSRIGVTADVEAGHITRTGQPVTIVSRTTTSPEGVTVESRTETSGGLSVSHAYYLTAEEALT